MSTSNANSFSFSPDKRVRHKRDYDRVFEGKCSAAIFPLRVYARPNELPHCRLGLIVSRRVGNSVVRNRVKRMLRESFRLLQHDLPAGYDLVVIVAAHEGRTLADYQALLKRAAEQLHRQWTRRPTST